MSESQGMSAYEPAADLSASYPPRTAAPGHLVGRVVGSTTRVESHGREFGSETVLSFRLLGPDGRNPREVLLRGRSISGSVRDGDWVEVSDRERSGRLEVAVLQNLTTGSAVQAGGSSSSPGAKVFRVVFLLVFVLILLAIVWIALGAFGVLDHGWFGDGGLFGGGGDGGNGGGEPFDPGSLDGSGR